MALSNGVPSTGNGLIVSFGEMLIDFVPTVSGVSLAEAPGFLKAPGGAPANVAIAVSRLGGKAAFVGKLGDDEFGHMLAGILKENGVRADGITFDTGARTALAFVTLRADGEREFMFYRNPSADMLLKPEELNLELIRSVCTLSLSPCFPEYIVSTFSLWSLNNNNNNPIQWLFRVHVLCVTSNPIHPMRFTCVCACVGGTRAETNTWAWGKRYCRVSVSRVGPFARSYVTQQLALGYY